MAPWCALWTSAHFAMCARKAATSPVVTNTSAPPVGVSSAVTEVPATSIGHSDAAAGDVSAGVVVTCDEEPPPQAATKSRNANERRDM